METFGFGESVWNNREQDVRDLGLHPWTVCVIEGSLAGKSTFKGAVDVDGRGMDGIFPSSLLAFWAVCV